MRPFCHRADSGLAGTCTTVGHDIRFLCRAAPCAQPLPRGAWPALPRQPVGRPCVGHARAAAAGVDARLDGRRRVAAVRRRCDGRRARDRGARLAWLRPHRGAAADRCLLVRRLPGRPRRPARCAVARAAGGSGRPQHGRQRGHDVCRRAARARAPPHQHGGLRAARIQARAGARPAAPVARRVEDAAPAEALSRAWPTWRRG